MPVRPPPKLLLAAAGMAALATAVAGARAASASAAGRGPVIVSCAGTGKAKPAGIVLACADANWGVRHLRWRHWGSSSSRAGGVGYANTCVPSCVSGHLVHYRVRVVASRLRQTADGLRYTRLEVRSAHRPPAHLPRVATFRLTRFGPSLI